MQRLSINNGLQWNLMLLQSELMQIKLGESRKHIKECLYVTHKIITVRTLSLIHIYLFYLMFPCSLKKSHGNALEQANNKMNKIFTLDSKQANEGMGESS